MRKWLIACILLLGISSRAFTQVLPDVSEALSLSGEHQFTEYAYSEEYVCDVWVFDRNYQTDEQISFWLLACIEEGFLVQKLEVDGYAAYRVQNQDGQYALLFPEYSGAVMLMVQQDMPYAPALPTPSPVPAATPSPGGGASASSGGHWESVLVEKDCPSCVGGSCSLCHGTGTYRLYGEAVECSRSCSFCDGVGTYTTTQSIFVND